MIISSVTLSIPDWVGETINESGRVFDTIEKRMEFVISLAARNVSMKTGGPFAAAVFDGNSGEILSAGVNQVVPASCSLAHAEMLAIALAQKRMETFDLGAPGMPFCELVTSTAPCAMCLGAIPWSGVRRVVCGARDEDARRIGFDEGAKVSNWTVELKKRGIEVLTDFCRDKAKDVLDKYYDEGGEIYNSRKG